MNHTESRQSETDSSEFVSSTQSNQSAADHTWQISELELPDTPVNRLLSQNETESPQSEPPSLFAVYAEDHAVLEAVSSKVKDALESAKTLAKRPGTPFFIFGVLIPASAILLEMAAEICAKMFFDPMPTVWHTLLICSVPLANLAVWWELKEEDAEYSPWLGAASGLAIGVSAYYSLLFLPLLAFAALGIIFLGIGVLGFSPQFAVVTSIRGAIYLRRLKRQQPERQSLRPSLAACLTGGIALSLLVLIGLEVRTTMTRVNLQKATSSDPTTRLNGIRWLRSYGSEDTMLRACYWRSIGASDFVGSLLTLGDPIDAEEARSVFYRVTGMTFDSLPKPVQPANGIIDFDRGTDQIRGVLKGLVLSSSRIDGSIDADAALGYFEWTMVFKNETVAQQEARAQIQLPPGGVVSRLTLWINGEPREAAFASRGKVQAAYQEVVRVRRDPVLITSSGDDRVLVQCFPVPPNGEMKIRFGVTAPITMESKVRGWLLLPNIAERNFGVENLSHAVWFESKRKLESSHNSLLAESPGNRLAAVRGSIADNELNSSHALIRVERSTDADEFWTPDPLAKSADAIHQQIRIAEWPRPSRIVLTIDGSKSMHPHLLAVADSLQRLPEGIEVITLVSGDEVIDLSGKPEHGSREFYGSLAEKIRQMETAGGNDNLQALKRAWDLASQKAGSLILWIHEPKPLLLGNADELRQRWERRPDNPRLFDLQTTDGANRIAEILDGLEAVETVTRTGSLTSDLDRLFARWRGESKQVFIFREKVERKNQELRDDLQETSSHLARLWAFDETRRLLATKDSEKLDQAVKLAASYQLVTPATGAVVLETAEQYERAGLQPVPPNSVPTIPEPEEWLLMIVAMSVLSWLTLRRRFSQRLDCQ